MTYRICRAESVELLALALELADVPRGVHLEVTHARQLLNARLRAVASAHGLPVQPFGYEVTPGGRLRPRPMLRPVPTP